MERQATQPAAVPTGRKRRRVCAKKKNEEQKTKDLDPQAIMIYLLDTYLSYLISLNIPAILDLSLNICLVCLNLELLPMAIEHFLYALLSYGMNCLFSYACRQIYKHLNQD